MPLTAISPAPIISDTSINVPQIRLDSRNAQISPVYSNGASTVAVARWKLANNRNWPMPPNSPAPSMPSHAGVGAGVWVQGNASAMQMTNTTLVISICSSTEVWSSTWRSWI
ncbi:hypothetical protein D3C87_1488840 [compost metagenome]